MIYLKVLKILSLLKYNFTMNFFKSNDILRIFFLMLYIFFSVFTYTSIAVTNEDFSLGLNLIKSVLLLMLIITGFSTINSYKIYFLVFILLLCIATLDSYVISLVFLSLIIISTKDLLSKNDVLKYLNRISLIGFILVLFGYSVGYLENIIFYDSLGYGLSIRESLGFFNPNPASLLLFSSVIVSLYIKDYLAFIISLLLFIFLIPFFGSRTYLYSFVIFGLVYIFSKSSLLKKLINILVLLFLIVFPIILYFLISVGNWNFMGIDLNSVTSDRLNRIRIMFFENGGINLFPSLNIDVVDSGLTNILLKLGLIFYLFFVYFNYRNLIKIENSVLYS